MSKFFLTIGIPTFNGANTISDTLESLVAQFDDDILETVEVVVSNNGSTDDTTDVVKKYLEKYPDNIKLIDNESTHLALDGNLINIFDNCSGEYVWIMSDDDAFEMGALRRVKEILLKNADVSVVLTNYSECDSELNFLPVRHREDIALDEYCFNGDEFFIKSKMLFGLVSALVIKVSDWKSSDLRPYIGLGSLHVGALIEILSNNESYIISDKLIKLRTGNTSWGKKGTFIFPILNIVKMFNGISNKGYSESTEKKIVGHFFGNNLRSLIVAKSQGLGEMKYAYSEMRSCYGNKVSFWLYHVPMLFLPNRLFYFLANSIRYLRSKWTAS